MRNLSRIGKDSGIRSGLLLTLNGTPRAEPLALWLDGKSDAGEVEPLNGTLETAVIHSGVLFKIIIYYNNI